MSAPFIRKVSPRITKEISDLREKVAELESVIESNHEGARIDRECISAWRQGFQGEKNRADEAIRERDEARKQRDDFDSVFVKARTAAYRAYANIEGLKISSESPYDVEACEESMSALKELISFLPVEKSANP